MHPEPTGAHLSLLGCPASPELLQSLGRSDSPLLQILLQLGGGGRREWVVVLRRALGLGKESEFIWKDPSD